MPRAGTVNRNTQWPLLILSAMLLLAGHAPCDAGTLLAPGYLSTRGNQIVDAQGVPQRIAAVGWAGGDNDSFVPDGLYAINYKATMQRIVQAGFNAIRVPYCDTWITNPDAHPPPGAISDALNPDLRGLTALQVLDRVIAEAGHLGLKIILDHHNNDCQGGQQANGLWYSKDVSAAQFEHNWLTLARRYAGNATVIGYDLDNEVLEPATWGTGGKKDWAAEATRLGDMLQAIDPQPLIIVEGVITWHREPTMPLPSCMTNLEGVHQYPLHLNVPHKLVYSVHEYPPGVSDCGWNNASSSKYDLPGRWNTNWGFVVRQGIAPVWIGEAGSSLQTQADRTWARMFVPYINGKFGSQGGPQVKDDEPGIGWCWWAWTYDSPHTDPDGLLERDWHTLKPDQLALIKSILPRPR
jgi:endoglucanase